LKEGKDGMFRYQSRDTRSPVWISWAAALTVSGVMRLSAPSSSSLPYRPHALPGGPFLSSGRSSNGGRDGGDILPVNLVRDSLYTKATV
jgi:hypothetical protein